MHIRLIEEKDYTAWLPLWNAYTAFYGASVANDITQNTWNRFFDPNSSIQAHVAEQDDIILGFVTSVLHEATWVSEPVCYLEDLYVAEEARGKGIGRKLIENLVHLGKKHNWRRVYWHTNADNKTARVLYDKLATVNDYVRYEVSLPKE